MIGCAFSMNRWLLLFCCLIFSSRGSPVAADVNPQCEQIKKNPSGEPIRIRYHVEQGDIFEITCTFCDDRKDALNWYFRPKYMQINSQRQMVESDGPEIELSADPFTLTNQSTFNHLRVDFKHGAWSECNACGDTPGEQERTSECRVKFSYPQGYPMDKENFDDFLYWLVGLEVRDAYELAFPYSKLMEDYETMKVDSIRSRCNVEASRQAVKAQAEYLRTCLKQLETADAGYANGMSCRNWMYLLRWEAFGDVGKPVFPPHELIGGLVETRTCRTNCSVDASAVKKAKKILRKKGLSLRNILRRQEKRTKNNTILGEVEIKVVKPKEAPPDMRVALIYLAVGTLCDLVIFVGVMIARHRQRLAVRMKGYKELYDDS
ncbi:hypothetical protein BV898_11824 [Hypsibius exemplaris]|uniref:Ig-like domain-containing protein n=1 Tax=Hypsibius exemplaris TaxID=2072580 RepID=A0A1W0WFI9_HYPEX|nr:hypothetical protein BV898_11824 [Hypsibius exemplaris]